MKQKWLFLPDIFFVLLLFLTCERHEMDHMREKGNKSFTQEPDQHQVENNIVQQGDRKLADWRKLIPAENGSEGSLWQ